jgi:3-dehydroquinate dehydratase/shikimate dehydrogenase
MNQIRANSSLPRVRPPRLPRVCVAVAAANCSELLAKAEAAVVESPFLEFRLDYLKQPAASLAKLHSFCRAHPEAVFIATCRRAANGGKFHGSAEAELKVLLKAAASGFQLVDLELQTAHALKPGEIAKLRSQAGLILSYHDFRATRKLEETFRQMAAIPANYYKLATTATCLYDNVLMMKFLEAKSREHSVVGLCMGEQGIISRLLALRAGSAFTFASAIPGEETGPGQLTARTLREIYRLDHLDAATRIYGVAGNPVAQSLSPLMLNTAFRRENVNAVYLALYTKELDDLVACVREVPISGLSITMPYKENIVGYLDNTDTLTQKTGACNTVVRSPDGRLFGFNTDVAGVLTPLEQRLPLAGAKVLLIGAGGAARAAAFGLKNRGVQLFVINRTSAKGLKLARQSDAKYLKRAEVKKHVFDVIINATPLGMDSTQVPLTEQEIHARFVFDMIYTSAETPFTRAGRAAGAEVISGAEMFVQQGARQFEIWTGKPAPAQEMLNVVAAALAAGNRKAEARNQK